MPFVWIPTFLAIGAIGAQTAPVAAPDARPTAPSPRTDTLRRVDSTARSAIPSASDSLVRRDTTRPSDSLLAKARKKNQPPPPPYQAPAWSWEIAPRFGVLAVDFPERSNFSSDLSLLSLSDSLVVRQPFPGSDLAWTAGLDLVVRRRDDFRLVAGASWTGWSAQAIAGRRDSVVRALSGDSLVYRSYSADLWTGELGADILIPRRILSVDAARDAFFGIRFRAGVGTLQGNSTAIGFCSGESFLLGADVMNWRRWALSGMLAWNTTIIHSGRAWSDVLWNTSTPAQVSWNGGGLSLVFQLRWGPDRDTTGLAASAGPQKK